MANTWVTPRVIARTGIATLYDSLVLAALVWRDFDREFTGKQGASIDVPIPAVLEATDFDRTTRRTDWQDVTEDTMPITLDYLSHVPVKVTDEETTLELSDFEERVIDPAMHALAALVDSRVANALVEAARSRGQLAELAALRDPNAVIRRARTILTRRRFPLTDRSAVLSPEATEETLGDKTILEADKSGSTEALRQANVGSLFGFGTYETQVFGGDTAEPRDEAGGAAFHRTAVSLAVRPLARPRSQVEHAIVNFGGLSIRVITTYDHDGKTDKTTADILYGIAKTRPNGAVELDYAVAS